MHWQKFMKEANEQREQYTDGLITEAELLAGTQNNLNKIIEQVMQGRKMHINTVINHEQKFKERIKDIFRRSNHFCLTSKQINDMYSKEILQSAVHAKLPRYSKSFLQGYREALNDAYWKNVKWVLPFDGVMYNGWIELPEEGKELYRSSKNIQGFHVYISDETKHFTGSKDDYQTGVKK